MSRVPEAYTLLRYIEDLRTIVGATSDEDAIIGRVAPLARRQGLEKLWLQPQHRMTDATQGFGTHLLHEEPDHSLAIFVVAWLPGRGAPPHDHGTWAVVAGVEGEERNIRYRRLDDRSRADYAKLEAKDEIVAGPGELVCMRSGGIHAVRNESAGVSLSFHTYGRHVNFTRRSQFDLASGAVKPFVVRVS